MATTKRTSAVSRPRSNRAPLWGALRLLPLLLVSPLGDLFPVASPFASAAPPERFPPYAVASTLRADASLHAVSFLNQDSGVAVGDRGTIIRTIDGGDSWQTVRSTVTCRLNQVRWLDERHVIVIGGGYDRVTGLSRGVVLLSDDGGKNWRRGLDEELPRLRHLNRDAESGALIAVGDYSHVALCNQFESHDRGQTWQGTGQNARVPQTLAPVDSAAMKRWAVATGSKAPIRAVCRVGDDQWWAVGDHGVVLQSRDRGRHWRPRRGEGRGAAVMIVAASVDSVAWPLIGFESLEMRNRVSLLIDSPELSDERLDLVSQVTVMLGGAGADRLRANAALPKNSGLPEPEDQQRAASATRWIGVHRPHVLVLDQNLSAATRSALTDAAVGAGIARIVSYGFGSSGDTKLYRGALLPKRGVLLSDLWEDALNLVSPDREPPESIAMRRVYDSVGTALQGDSVTMGLPIEEGCRLVASFEPAARRQLQIVQARMNGPKQIQKLISQSRTETELADSFESMLDHTAKEDRFRLAWSLLRTVRDGRTEHSRWREQTVLSVIAERFAETSAGKWAALQGHGMRHSREWDYLRQFGGSSTAAQTVVAAKPTPVSPFQVEPDPTTRDPSQVQQASAVSPIVVPEKRMIDLTPKSQSAAEIDLNWEFHPVVLVSREASRHRGDDDQLQVTGTGSANLERLVGSSPSSPWGQLLRSGGGRMIVARRTLARPRLDGRLDEPCWDSALTQAGRPFSMQIAYDDEFVYFALQTPAEQLRPHEAIEATSRSRRDYDLNHVDRLRIRIDTDLDLLTAMQLEVSREELTRDAIDGHLGWQPDWFIKTHRDGDLVNVELAILRRDIVELPIHRGQIWFVGADTLPAGKQPAWRPMPIPDQWLRVVFQ